MNYLIKSMTVFFFLYMNWFFFFRGKPKNQTALCLAACILISPFSYIMVTRLLYTAGGFFISFIANKRLFLNRKFLNVVLLFLLIYGLLFPYMYLYSKIIHEKKRFCCFLFLSFMIIELTSYNLGKESFLYLIFYSVLYSVLFIILKNDVVFMIQKNIDLDYKFLFFIGILIFTAALGSSGMSLSSQNLINGEDISVFRMWIVIANILNYLIFMLSSKIILINMEQAVRIAIDAKKEKKSAKRMLSIQENVIVSFAGILESKSGESGNHVKRVSEYVRILASDFGYSPEKNDEIRIASMMHDVGKILIPNEILEKKGKLSHSEKEIMKQHAEYGAELLRNTSGEIMKYAYIIALQHHERWDGDGYPNGIRNENIALESRIVSLCDVFDALVSKRSYKAPWTPEEAKQEIVRQSGKQFDPECVSFFLCSFNDFLCVLHSFPDTK